MTTSDFPLPESALILGAVWRALDLQLPRNAAQSLRKFLRGKRYLRDREGAVRSIVRVFAADYLPVEDSERELIVGLIAGGVTNLITRWDQLVGHARMFDRHPDRGTATERYLRLAAVDIAVRTAALDVILGTQFTPGAFEGTAAPAWAAERSHKTFTEAFKAAVRSKRTPKKLTSGLGDVEAKSAEEWLYRSKWPSLETIATIAKDVFATTSSWKLHLAWHRALSIISNELSKILERHAVVEIAIGFRRIRHHACALILFAAANGKPIDAQMLFTKFSKCYESGKRAGVDPLSSVRFF